jgi:hypothetical protein
MKPHKEKRGSQVSSRPVHHRAQRRRRIKVSRNWEDRIKERWGR